MGKKKNIKNCEKKQPTLIKGALLGALVTLIITQLINLLTEDAYIGIKNFFRMPEQLSDVHKEMQLLTEDIGNVQNNLDDLSGKVNVLADKHDEDLREIRAYLGANSTLKVSLMDGVSIEHNVVENEIFLAEPKWSETDVIVRDTNTNKAYKAEDLVGTSLLIPYTEGNQEIYFLGQFNENCHWDGNCITNVYENDNLIFIMDAVYNDGVLSEYKQVESSGNGNLWRISKRINEEAFNSGETWLYTNSNNVSFVKNFTMNDVKKNSIFNVNEFVTSLGGTLLTYYHGNTSAGKYNDNTGNAYLVKFSSTGYVLTLYQGRFSDGKFDDKTGKAWYIVKEDDTPYMYYKGVFSKGNIDVDDSKATFEHNISQERINEIIKTTKFDIELKWDEFSVKEN